MKIKSQLGDMIAQALENCGLESGDRSVNEAGKPEFGDYQYNGAMAMAKRYKSNPRELAERIVSSFPDTPMVESLEIAGPGFVNIRISRDWLEKETAKLFRDPRLGVGLKEEPLKTVVDYSSPNMAKQMHVGHLRSTIIGDSLSNLFSFLGDEVIRQNHIGDWGTQFGMLIAYLEELGEGAEGSLKDIEEFYRSSKKRFDEDPAFADKSREYVVKLQGGDIVCLNLWNEFIDKSLSHCEDVYGRLHVNLSRKDVKAESSYNDELSSVVDELERKGLLVQSKGARCVFPEEGKAPLIIQKSDGGYLYATTDLAAIRYRCLELGAKRICYVVDARQSEHFRQVFAVAEMAGFSTDDTALEHISFGMMLDRSGRPFKTRDGGTVQLMDLLDEAVARAGSAITQRDEYSDSELEKIAEIVGIGAVKYADLSINRESNYIFDWDRMLSLEGNTSLYLQYAYARIQSILRKYGREVSGDLRISDELEKRMALKLLQFEDTLHAAAKEAMPHIICTYLYELTTLFMRFYENNPILKGDVDDETRTSRLILASATALTIRTALGILGIKVLDRL